MTTKKKSHIVIFIAVFEIIAVLYCMFTRKVSGLGIVINIIVFYILALLNFHYDRKMREEKQAQLAQQAIPVYVMSSPESLYETQKMLDETRELLRQQQALLKGSQLAVQNNENSTTNQIISDDDISTENDYMKFIDSVYPTHNKKISAKEIMQLLMGKYTPSTKYIGAKVMLFYEQGICKKSLVANPDVVESISESTMNKKISYYKKSFK